MSDYSYSNLYHPDPRPHPSHVIDTILDTTREFPLRPITPPPGPPNARVRSEKPTRLVGAPIRQHSPHNCPYKELCFNDIRSKAYHRTRAAYLIAAANRSRSFADKLFVNIHELNEEGWDLVDVTWAACEARSLLETYWISVDEVLRGIQSPEFWEAERAYLDSPGCRYERDHNGAAARESTGMSGAVPAKGKVTPLNGDGTVARISNAKGTRGNGVGEVERKRKRQDSAEGDKRDEGKDTTPSVPKRTRVKSSLPYLDRSNTQMSGAVPTQTKTAEHRKARNRGKNSKCVEEEMPWTAKSRQRRVDRTPALAR